MGEVWEAVLLGPRGFRRPVALKLLPAGPADAEAETALVEEARLGALLQHPNVVATYELGCEEGTWFFAMELVRGTSAGGLLRAGPLSPATAVEIAIQAAAGLAHVHAAGLVHRDVKPQNLLVDRAGLVKLADLGVAAWAGSHGAAGTMGYMAPEQAEGRAEARSDVFALGATLYALLVGRKPFGSGRVARETIAHLDAGALRGLVVPVDAALAPIVRRCLDPDPARRWASAAELGAALLAVRRTLPGPPLLEVAARAVGEGSEVLPSAGSAKTVLLRRGNVPVPRDRFFGRSEELDELVGLLRSGERVVTLHGLGGMGKTRLSIEAARRLDRDVEGGAWFFDLSDARTPDALCAGLAHALALDVGRDDPVERVGFALRGRGPALFVLDNLEQVAEHVPAVVGRWIDRAPDGRFLCTSRVLLGLRGERRFPVGAISADEGVRLFLDRSAPVPEAHRPAVREVVHAVEGMPLAIELAAARTRVLPVPALLERLQDRLRVLGGGGPDRPDRHKTLRAALDGSWEILAPAARSALAQLSVFDGGFAFEAAEAVVEADGGWVLDLLGALADASLLRVDAETGRFTLPVVVQEYARERLEPEVRAAAEVRHGRFFAQLGAPDALAAMHGPGQVGWFRRAREETDNLFAAARRAIARREGPVAAGSALAAAVALRQTAPGSAVPLLSEVLPIAPPERRAQVAAALGAAFQLERRMEDSVRVLEAELAIERSGGGRSEAQLLGVLAIGYAETGRRDEARACYLAALERHRAAGDQTDEAHVIGNLGSLERSLGRLDEARACFEDAFARHRALGDRRSASITLLNLGVLLQQTGRPAEALRCYEDALAGHRAVGDRWEEPIVLGNLAIVLSDLGRVGEARAATEAAVALARELGAVPVAGRALTNLSVILRSHGDADGAVAAASEALGLTRAGNDRQQEPWALAVLGTALQEAGRGDEAERAYRESIALHGTVAATAGQAVALSNFGNLLREQGRTAEAVEVYDRALAILRPLGNHRSAAIVLLNRSHVAEASGRTEEAHGLVAEALELARRVSAASVVAACLCRQGLLRARAGDPRGREDVAEGEAGFRAAGLDGELAKALCGRAEAEHYLGGPEAARRALSEAERISTEIRAAPGSAVGRELARVRTLLNGDRGSA